MTFEHLNKNFLWNKFDQLPEMVQGFVDIFFISESKLDDSFPEGQLIIDGYRALFRFDQTGMEGDFSYMSVRTHQQKFYTVVFLLLKDFLLRLFSIRKDG